MRTTMQTLSALLIAVLVSAELTSQASFEDVSQQDVDGALAEMIDALAGHPDDALLPADAVGASDEALLATNAREIADILQVGLPFARERAPSARFQFALGRAALAHGYGVLGRELLLAASEEGSAAALAYLGYAAEAENNTTQAAEYFRQAIEGGFDSRPVHEALAALSRPGVGSGRFNASDFNRPSLVQALHDGNPQVLEDSGLDALIYVGTIHATLWDSNILFLAEDPAILLELDPNLGFAIAQKTAASTESIQEGVQRGAGALFGMLEAMADTRRGGGSIVDELSAVQMAGAKNIESTVLAENHGIQDGRRLAILYNTDPGAFRRVYQGARMFARGVNSVRRHDAQRTRLSSGSTAPGTRRSAAPQESLDDPVSMYERLNRDVASDLPVLFRITDGIAYICGKDASSGAFRIERVNYGEMRKFTDRGASIPIFMTRERGFRFAFDTYGSRFASVADLVEVAASAPLEPTWCPTGPVRTAVERRALEQTIYISDVSTRGAPFFFCEEPDSEIAYLHLGDGVVYVIYVTALQEHLSGMDAIITKTGSYFGATRDEHLATVGGRGTAAGVAMSMWPDLFPTLPAFIESAAQASIQPSLFR